MKKTDYMPRPAMFDYYVAKFRAGRPQAVGLELGVDAGAHAQSMAQSGCYTSIDLVDPWEERYYEGICKGRLDALGWYGRYGMFRMTAQRFLKDFAVQVPYDAIYCDLPQDGKTASEVVAPLWQLLHMGGIFGYRNYCDSWPEMKAVLDAHVQATGAVVLSTEGNELVLQKV